MITRAQLRKQNAELQTALTTCESEKAILLAQYQQDEETIVEQQARIAELEGKGSLARHYSDASPFNQVVVPGMAEEPNSQNIVARLNGLGPPAKLSVGATGIRDWTHPLYFATESDPLCEIVSTGWRNPDVDRKLIRVPTYARPAGGDDASMAVVQPVNAQGEVWEYDFWQAKAPVSGWQSCNFARRGLFNGDGLGSDPERGGITAARFSNALGLIRYDEIAAGEIPHALFMSVKGWNGRVWPSIMSSKLGTGEDPDDTYAPAMGQHFWLDMSEAEIASFPLWKQTILRAMARYGLYVGDNGSAPWALQLESGTQYVAQGKPDPWIGWAKMIGVTPDASGVYRVDFGAGVDWSRLRVLA